jgi:DNA-directed RNA polymerase specialized sigma24 family protein
VSQMSSASVVAIERETSQRSSLPRARFERIFAEQHAIVWRMLRRFGFASDKAAEGTQWVFAQASGELSRCAPGRERALLLAVGLKLLDAYRHTEAWSAGTPTRAGARAQRGARPAELDVPQAEPGQSGIVHAAPLRSTSAPGDMMDRVLLRMTRASATVFFLFEIEGLSLGETSRVLGVDEASAHAMLLQARQEFRAIAAELSEAMRRV